MKIERVEVILCQNVVGSRNKKKKTEIFVVRAEILPNLRSRKASWKTLWMFILQSREKAHLCTHCKTWSLLR